MTKIAIYDADGLIVRTVTLTGDPVIDADLVDIPVGGDAVVGDYDSDEVYFPSGVETARPSVTVDPEYTIVADGVDAVTFDIPDGTSVSVISLEERRRSVDGNASCITDVADADDLYTFTTKRRGDWELRIYPPTPYAYSIVFVRAI